MFEQQPMKMASAESLCHTETDPNFSILTIGTHNDCDGVIHVLDVPYVLPFLAQGEFSGVTLQASRTCRRSTNRNSAPATTSPTCSSPTGRSAR